MEPSIVPRRSGCRPALRSFLLFFVAALGVLEGFPPARAHGVLALRPGFVDREGDLAAGDFNADGRLDLLVTNLAASDLSLFQEDALGGYVERSPSPHVVLEGPTFIATADVNKDGRMDAVVLDRVARSLSIRLSDPDLVFRATPNLIVGRSIQTLAIADFTGDTRPDLAVTNDQDEVVYLFSGRGDGTFGFLRSIDARTASQKAQLDDVGLYGIAAADFNRDGKMDIAVTQRNTDLLAVLLGNGNGTFKPPVMKTLGRHPTTIEVGRFNDDQAPGAADDFVDLVVLLEGGRQNPQDPSETPQVGGVSMLRGNGDGTFLDGAVLVVSLDDAPIDLAAGRMGLGAAGFDDLAVVNFGSNTVFLYPAAGAAGGFLDPEVLGGAGTTLRNPRAIALMDRDANGIVDRLALANFGSYSLTLFDGGGGTPFVENPLSPITATRHPVQLSVGGLDAGFGDDLAVVSDADPTLQTFSSLDNGFFFKRRATPLGAGTDPTSIVLGDFDRDALVDALVALADADGSAGLGSSPAMFMLKGSGGATFGFPAGRCGGGTNAGGHCASDAACPGGECAFSLSFGHCAAGTNAGKVCSGDGDCPSSTCTLPLAPVPLAGVATTIMATDLNPQDADRDGVPNATDNCPARYNPAQTETRGLTCLGGTNPGAACSIDPNCPGGGTCSVSDGRGDDCDSATADPDADRIFDKNDNCPDLYNPTQGDLDVNRVGDACDHALDVVVLEGGSVQGEIFLGQPEGGFLPSVALPTGTDPASAVVGNFSSGDTFPDLAVTNRGSGNFQVFAGDGSGQFLPLSPVAAGAAPGALAALEVNSADLDMDGIANLKDNCPTRYNPAQTDADGDGMGDACSQVDPEALCAGGPNDGALCLSDAGCPGGTCLGDHDFVVTRVEQRQDNCPDVYNPSQTDTDGDLIGDACDLNPSAANPSDDNDSDGAVDAGDNCPTRYNPDQRDSSGNGVGDACDEESDPDGDRIATAKRIRDNCPDTYNPGQEDVNFNGIGDACENVLDLAMIDEASDQLEIFIQSPPGSWVPLTPLPTGSQPRELVAADLNGDGIVDLAVANAGDSTVDVFLGEGDGFFLSDPSFSPVQLPAPLRSLRSGDMVRDIVRSVPELAGVSQPLNNPLLLANVIQERADITTCSGGTTPNSPCRSDADCGGAGNCRGSGRVDGRDLAVWAKGFGLARGNPGYDSLLGADVNLDGKIDGFDLVYITSQFGSDVPP
ncbi:MAG TPA: FG-GAP-like repeat-containing protein [Candidatus Polarisedimenticolia bacterium]|nr:FG-GAP-like repeat-containing protein [Candidatus Polarisedimenticolia bacterium]